MYKTVRSLVIVLVVCLASLLATTGLASAAPTLTPARQAYAKCIAEAGVKALKEIDKQTWKDKRAREAALKALVEKIKAACPKPGTTAPTPYTVTETRTSAGKTTLRASCRAVGDQLVDFTLTLGPGTVAEGTTVTQSDGTSPATFSTRLDYDPPATGSTATVTITCQTT